MNNQYDLKKALSGIAISYILIHIHVKLGTVDILPEWVGYLIIYRSLPAIGAREASAKLLRPLTILLLLISIIQWLLSLFGASIPLSAIPLLALIIALYFHFQLLSNLASIMEAYSYPKVKTILRLRTVRTIINTAAYLPLPFIDEIYIQTTFLFAFLIIIIWLCVILRNMARWINQQEGELTESS